MRRSGRSEPPVDLPIHRWAHVHELEDGEPAAEIDWARELLRRREQREVERRRREARKEDLDVELAEFVRAQRRS
jgi:hypothetical protein